ncbi:MAG: hypothetical protein HKL91_02400 [Candidatus Eremiobacteraeota bacterium]|nr:hypothetical protein [Candidatus Eremiobacteraeota bacterium]
MGDVTIQGVRAYDPSTAQWVSPDAYAGTTTDPGSQKPFMWNGNNPVAYGDPSGYDATTWEALSGATGEGACVVAEPCGLFVTLGIVVAVGIADVTSRPVQPSAKNESKPRGPDSWPQLTKENLPSSYKPPKRKGQPDTPRWGRNGKGEEGWIDRKGNIWQEPKPGERHGAPHWDVQYKDGTHDNVDAKIPVIL